MKDKEARYAYGFLLAISFLGTGMLALITFPRSIRLVDVGISVAFYDFCIEWAYRMPECFLWQID